MIELITLLIAIAIILILYKIIKNSISNTNNEQQEQSIQNNKIIYKQKPLLTETEKNFYLKLKDLEPQYKIIPQISLNAIVDKVTDNKYRTELFRNIDYGIFTNDLSNILLLIELNDQTHNQPNRKKRDIKVKEICQNANIPIITFYTNYPNEKEYVLNRILTEINKYTNNTESIAQEQINNNIENINRY